MERIIVVDNEPGIVSVLSTLLKAEGYDVLALREAEKALERVESETFDLLISDIRMSPMDGMTLLKRSRVAKPGMPVIMLTAYATVETAIEAMKLGAFDYVTKPFKLDDLLLRIRRALEYRRTMLENQDLREQLGSRYKFENIVAESPAMRQVCEMIARVAPSDVTVLIYGESGTGKELVAKAIHGQSPRRNKKFMDINCAALPEPLLESEMFGHVKGAFTGASVDKVGLFEAAEGGTIFLDEIGSMPMSIQSKLLRVLQEKKIRRVGSNENIPVDVRVLAATNTRLETLLSQNAFREDLYYRLSVIGIEVKPLRDRQEDIMPLVQHFLRNECKQNQPLSQMDPEVSSLLQRYAWPGNVREVENTIKHAVTFSRGNRITLGDLPGRLQQGGPQRPQSESAPPAPAAAPRQEFQELPLRVFLRRQERDYINWMLDRTGGNKKRAAEIMQVSLATFYRKLPDMDL